MEKHLVIVLRNGRVEMVATDFVEAELTCVVANPEPAPAIQGEPWIRQFESMATGKMESILITPVHVEFLPEAVHAIVGAGDASKLELLELLKPGERQ